MESLLASLQDGGIGAAIRQSVFLYPAANVLHVLAIMSFFGFVAAMDLALLGASGAGRRTVARLRPWAGATLIVIALTGFVLFAAEAVAIAANPAFRLKLAMIVLALANVAAAAWAARQDNAAVLRRTAALSLGLWLVVAALGRLIAYI